MHILPEPIEMEAPKAPKKAPERNSDANSEFNSVMQQSHQRQQQQQMDAKREAATKLADGRQEQRNTDIRNAAARSEQVRNEQARNNEINNKQLQNEKAQAKQKQEQRIAQQKLEQSNTSSDRKEYSTATEQSKSASEIDSSSEHKKDLTPHSSNDESAAHEPENDKKSEATKILAIIESAAEQQFEGKAGAAHFDKVASQEINGEQSAEKSAFNPVQNIINESDEAANNANALAEKNNGMLAAEELAKLNQHTSKSVDDDADPIADKAATKENDSTISGAHAAKTTNPETLLSKATPSTNAEPLQAEQLPKNEDAELTALIESTKALLSKNSQTLNDMVNSDKTAPKASLISTSVHKAIDESAGTGSDKALSSALESAQRQDDMSLEDKLAALKAANSNDRTLSMSEISDGRVSIPSMPIEGPSKPRVPIFDGNPIQLDDGASLKYKEKGSQAAELKAGAESSVTIAKNELPPVTKVLNIAGDAVNGTTTNGSVNQANAHQAAESTKDEILKDNAENSAAKSDEKMLRAQLSAAEQAELAALTSNKVTSKAPNQQNVSAFQSTLEAAMNVKNEQANIKVNEKGQKVLQETINILRSDFAANMKEKLSLMLGRKVQIADIRLDPPELGKMQVKMTIQQEQASVSFVVQNPQAKEALEQAMPKLRELLEESGINLGESSVEQGDKEHNAWSDDEPNTGTDSSLHSKNEQAEDAEATIVPIVGNKIGGIDFYA